MTKMRLARNRIARELRALIPVWVFFLLAFSLLRLTSAVLLSEHGLQPERTSLVLIGSIIVAKVFLIAEKLPFTDRMRDRPVMQRSLWKTSIYFVGCLVFQYLDAWIRLSRAGNALKAAGAGALQEMGTPRFWVIQLWLILLLLAWSSTRELIYSLGRERFTILFFGPKPMHDRREAA